MFLMVSWMWKGVNILCMKVSDSVLPLLGEFDNLVLVVVHFLEIFHSLWEGGCRGEILLDVGVDTFLYRLVCDTLSCFFDELFCTNK